MEQQSESPPPSQQRATATATKGGTDAVDAIIDQWRVARPDLRTDAMATFGRIYRLARIMGDRIEKIYQEYGISRGEFDVLATLRRAPAPHTLSPRELTAALMLTTGGMTGRLDKLERAGLVLRSPDPADRRGLRITLTDAGRTVTDQAVAAGLVEQQRALSRLDDEQARQLNELLRLLLIDI
ncbi:MarR family transcriptional regulator [Kitasatospora sp. NBC_01250]|uniref:MarR family winged helix-turn-helix transcriptional regulator n=1 Tax=unclassified Kitasatospora TaxID=2633591 RepID=UPI002E0DE0E5|nr:MULTISPECIES: MarR family transcriptional regulator [unclassified Kitasatospora]WSJ68063.1 MarR family transcriptional regulator [Kitasatospora sp. NBC_01302]